MVRNIQCIMACSLLLFGIACKQSGSSSKLTADAPELANSKQDSFKLDTAQSIIYWQGSSPTGAHNGSLKFKSGILYGSNMQIQSGDLLIDMNQIVVLDISDPSDRHDLESHLKDADFFDINQYPTAAFTIHHINELKDSVNNVSASGILKIKDRSNPLQVNGKIDYSKEGIMVSIPEFTIDRTAFNIMYSSKKILASLKDGFIHDEVKLTIKIVALKI